MREGRLATRARFAAWTEKQSAPTVGGTTAGAEGDTWQLAKRPHKQFSTAPRGRQGGQRMNVFKDCREAVSAKEAALRYGVYVDHHGKALCPFHDDHHPSMTFRDGRYHCWACGATGDSIAFTARLLGLTPFEAVRRLNKDFCLGLPLDRPPTNEERAAAEKYRWLEETNRCYEAWRNDMLLKLNAACRVGHLAWQSGHDLTDQEALAVRWLEHIEACADALDSNMEEQMTVFRQREELMLLCKKILSCTQKRLNVA